MRPYRPLVIPLALGLFGLGAASAALTAHAEPSAGSEEDQSHVLLVMDSSGSMAEDTGDGTTRIEAAKEALHAVTDAAPDGTGIGLRVYGARDTEEGSPASCRDSELAVPVAADNREELRAAIDSYEPVGWTPIDHALREAGKDIADLDGRRTIVLVSDGEESCVPDPCPAVKELTDQGIDVQVNTVGLNVSGKARSQLECIAEEGAGRYYEAEDADELEEALNLAATRQGRDFVIDGEPVQGGDGIATAPALEDGIYADQAVDKRYYRLTRQHEGSSVWFATMFRGTDFSTQVKVELHTPEGQRCGTDATSGISHHSAASLTGVSVLSSDDPECVEGDLIAVVTGPDDRPDMRLAYLEEPPLVEGAALPQPAEKDLTWESMDIPAPGDMPVDGGTSLGNAPLLPDGSHRVTVVPGEVQLFAVDLDWGQRLQAQLTGTRATEGYDTTRINIFSPLGLKVSERGEGGPQVYSQQSEVNIGATHPEIRYRNREEHARIVANTSLPGRYYVAVSVGDQQEAGTVGAESTFTLTTATLGEAGAGAPEYVGGEPATEVLQPTSQQDTPIPGLPSLGDMNWALVGGLLGGAVLLIGIGTALVVALRRG